MKNTNSGRRKRRKRDTDRLAAQLAPLEEINKPAAEQQVGGSVDANYPIDRHLGSIIVDSEHVKIGTDFVEGEKEKKHFLGIEPVVLVVLILVLSFIVFIAWQISLMPAR